MRTRRVSLHLAPNDEYFEDEEVTATLEAFSSAGATVETFVYEGSGHWFAERGSPGFDEMANASARTRVLAQLAVR